MKERKYVKFRCDMYEDTKFKIIDMKPERDIIHYVWTRLLTLAGKVNMMGDLYMSKNIPYTIRTLSIEFNRSEEQIKLAIDVFIELEMIELIDDKIYRVKNFAKHQNIKVDEKVKLEDKEVSSKSREAVEKLVIANGTHDKEDKKIENEDKNKEPKNEENHIRNEDKSELKVNNISGTNKENTRSKEISNNIPQNNIPIPFERKKNKKAATKKKKEEMVNVMDEEGKDEELISIKEGESVLGEGENIVSSWTF